MFLEVLLHLTAYKLVNHKWCIEFYNVHHTSVNNLLTFSGASYPLLRAGSIFLPFVFIEFKWTPLLVSLFLISISS